MSELTKRLRDGAHGFDRNGSHSEDRYVCLCEHTANLAADRIDALGGCLREFLAWADAPIGPHEQLAKVIDKARALLEAND